MSNSAIQNLNSSNQESGEEGPPEPGKMHGPDEFRNAKTGAVYKGTWQVTEEGVPFIHGEGTYTTGPEKFVGVFEEGDMVRGTYVSRNGHIYEGQFKGNKFHGEGKYTWPDQRT